MVYADNQNKLLFSFLCLALSYLLR